ncbi:MAG: hypothetical protein K0S39_5002 [Paenibacillus sp.]|nr:hypothetical protein [Paenibacillus sp.]
MSKLLGICLSLCLLLSGCIGKTTETAATPPADSIAKTNPVPAPATAPAQAAPSAAADNKPGTQSPGKTQQPSQAGGQAKDEPTPAKPAPEVTGNIPPEQAKKVISERTAEVIAALKNKDMKKLANYVHPDPGVRFSPYSYVEKKTDLIFKPDQLEKLLSDKTIRTWGHFDGSGEPIALTFADYYAKFVYNHDFAKAEKISYNETLGKGNTVNNIREMYPKAIVVEYYFSGFDKKLEGHDWASLRLVYEHKDNQWYLAGIVHDQWTI